MTTTTTTPVITDGLAARWPAFATTIIATVMFAVALALRTRIDPFVSTGIAAGVAIPLALWTLGRARCTRLFALVPRDVVVASALGIVLVLATHAVFAVVPDALRHTILALYRSIEGDISTPLLATITGTVVIAEELIWRGTALELVGSRSTRVAAGGLAVAFYVLPQLAGGAWLLVLAAIGLGSLFTWQRLATGGFVAPLVTHLIWSISIFVLVPLGR